MASGAVTEQHPGPRDTWRGVALVLGPLTMAAMLAIGAPPALSEPEWRLIAVASWMIIWWLSEAIPVPATGIIPLVAFPLFGIDTEARVAASYAHPLVFLFLGGLFLGAAIERSGLHRRVALAVVAAVGTSAPRLVAGFMLSGAVLSMWISNTAAAVMMFPLALSVISLAGTACGEVEVRPFGRALLLAVAWGCSIGGTVTLIGTPPNGLLAAFLSDRYGVQLSFSDWMPIGGSFAAMMLPMAWAWLTFVAFRLHRSNFGRLEAAIVDERRKLGPATREQKLVGAVFLMAVLLWLLRGVLVSLTGWQVSDSMVAMFVALVAFAAPVSVGRRHFLLDWPSAARVNWSVMFIFGSGLALAGAFEQTGLTLTLGSAVEGLSGLPLIPTVLILTTGVLMLTEFTSNTATTATLLPVLAAVAASWAVDPLILMMPVTLAASAAFMLPVATPPNAIVFAWEHLRISDMARSGLMMNVLSIICAMIASFVVGRLVLGGALDITP